MASEVKKLKSPNFEKNFQILIQKNPKFEKITK